MASATLVDIAAGVVTSDLPGYNQGRPGNKVLQYPAGPAR
jgi:hypothetical protein